MTIDDFLVVYGTKYKPNDKLKMSVRIEAIQIEVKGKKHTVSVTYGSGGFFNMNTTKNLVFGDIDVIEEFSYYVRQVKARRAN